MAKDCMLILIDKNAWRSCLCPWTGTSDHVTQEREPDATKQQVGMASVVHKRWGHVKVRSFFSTHFTVPLLVDLISDGFSSEEEGH